RIMLATMQPQHELRDMSQQQMADTLPLVEDRICPGCKLSAVTEEGGLVVAFGQHVKRFILATFLDIR
ncbi:hypothetical protein MPER_00946, partial [Moniliophthora perniciosa FA553]